MTQLWISLTENWRGHLRLFLAFVSLFGLQLLLTMQIRMRSDPVIELPAGSGDLGEKYNPALFETLTFGQMPAVVDWVWLKSLQGSTLAHVQGGNHFQMYYDLDLLTTLDPLFYEAYIVGANVLAVVQDDGRGALEILLKGQRFRKLQLQDYPEEIRQTYWKDEWDVPLLLGYVYLFELDDIQNASIAFKEAAALPRSPAYLQPLAHRFAQPGGQYEVGLKLTKFLIEGAHDSQMREKLIKREHSLEVGQFLFQINSQYKAKKYRSLTEFFQHSAFSRTDPWSGVLSLNESGRIVTTTPHQKVFGLE